MRAHGFHCMILQCRMAETGFTLTTRIARLDTSTLTGISLDGARRAAEVAVKLSHPVWNALPFAAKSIPACHMNAV